MGLVNMPLTQTDSQFYAKHFLAERWVFSGDLRVRKEHV